MWGDFYLLEFHTEIVIHLRLLAVTDICLILFEVAEEITDPRKVRNHQ